VDVQALALSRLKAPLSAAMSTMWRCFISHTVLHRNGAQHITAQNISSMPAVSLAVTGSSCTAERNNLQGPRFLRTQPCKTWHVLYSLVDFLEVVWEALDVLDRPAVVHDLVLHVPLTRAPAG